MFLCSFYLKKICLFVLLSKISYSVTVSLKRYYVKNLGINKRILF